MRDCEFCTEGNNRHLCGWCGKPIDGQPADTLADHPYHLPDCFDRACADLDSDVDGAGASVSPFAGDAGLPGQGRRPVGAGRDSGAHRRVARR